jgi:hypothetical protein
MNPVSFWLLHAAIASTGGLLIWIFGGTLRRVLDASAPQPMRPAAMTLEVES